MDKQAARGAYRKKKMLGWEEGWARFHPQGFMAFVDE